MMQREGYALPEPTRMQDGSETPRGPPGADGGGLAFFRSSRSAKYGRLKSLKQQ